MNDNDRFCTYDEASIEGPSIEGPQPRLLDPEEDSRGAQGGMRGALAQLSVRIVYCRYSDLRRS